jgi:glycosyltransferase involved in cell wall biosynthesis
VRPRVIYLADTRLPTEKAHGWQIVKMCEAFAAAGADVELRHPRRTQEDPALAEATVFAYYGVPETFRVRAIRGPDVVALEPRLPEGVSRTMIQGWSGAWELATTLSARSARPDLIYTRDLGVAVAAARLGLRVAYEVHQLPGPRTRRAIRWVASRPSLRIVALTPFVRDAFVADGFDPARVAVEGDAVDPAPFRDLPAASEARARLGLPADRPIAGFAGRFHTLEEEKGLPELVRAMAHVAPAEGRDPMLVCVGGPLDRVAAYMEIARASGVRADRLRFDDRVPHEAVPTWLCAFDVALMPYPDTPHYARAMSPLKVFEYMAAGTPIVATDLPTTRLVLRDGSNAVLVPPGDARAMGEAIGALFADPSRALRLASRARDDVEGVTWDARARRILAFAGVATPAPAEVAG